VSNGGGGGGGYLGKSVALLKIWEIWMYLFFIGLPYVREGMFFVGD